MSDAMATGRMSQAKKDAAFEILSKQGLNHSQAINLLYDKIIQEGSADFLLPHKEHVTASDIKSAASILSQLIIKPTADRFHSMTIKEAKIDRLANRGLL